MTALCRSRSHQKTASYKSSSPLKSMNNIQNPIGHWLNSRANHMLWFKNHVHFSYELVRYCSTLQSGISYLFVQKAMWLNWGFRRSHLICNSPSLKDHKNLTFIKDPKKVSDLPRYQNLTPIFTKWKTMHSLYNIQIYCKLKFPNCQQSS